MTKIKESDMSDEADSGKGNVLYANIIRDSSLYRIDSDEPRYNSCLSTCRSPWHMRGDDLRSSAWMANVWWLCLFNFNSAVDTIQHSLKLETKTGVHLNYSTWPAGSLLIEHSARGRSSGQMAAAKTRSRSTPIVGMGSKQHAETDIPFGTGLVAPPLGQGGDSASHWQTPPARCLPPVT